MLNYFQSAASGRQMFIKKSLELAIQNIEVKTAFADNPC